MELAVLDLSADQIDDRDLLSHAHFYTPGKTADLLEQTFPSFYQADLLEFHLHHQKVLTELYLLLTW